MTLRLLLDMNLSPRWVASLAESGLDAVHWANIGAHNATDTEILGRARAEEWVVVTGDTDFGTLLALSGAEAPSVVQLRSPSLMARDLPAVVASTIARYEAELRRGVVLTIDRAAARVRVLPISQE